MRPDATKSAPAQTTQIRILILDPQPIVRKGLTDLINDEPDMAVCGESETAAHALELVRTEQPDVAIVDPSLSFESGLAFIRTLATVYPEVRVLVFSRHDEMLFAERILHAGASGYVMKSTALPAMLTAIRQVSTGHTCFGEQVMQQIMASAAGRRKGRGDVTPFERLTDRERDVFEFLGRGLGTREIAGRLHLSIKTIESHQSRLKEKLGLKNIRELIRAAVTWSHRD
jgi:DNA-binding NarL/FixJ family response regulator